MGVQRRRSVLRHVLSPDWISHEDTRHHTCLPHRTRHGTRFCPGGRFVWTTKPITAIDVIFVAVHAKPNAGASGFDARRILIASWSECTFQREHEESVDALCITQFKLTTRSSRSATGAGEDEQPRPWILQRLLLRQQLQRHDRHIGVELWRHAGTLVVIPRLYKPGRRWKTGCPKDHANDRSPAASTWYSVNREAATRRGLGPGPFSKKVEPMRVHSFTVLGGGIEIP